MKQQVEDGLAAVAERAETVKGVAVTVIEANGSVTTWLCYPDTWAMAMLGAVEIAKDQIKAKLTVGPTT